MNNNGYYIYIPFAPSNYDVLETSDGNIFNVKNLIEGAMQFTLYQNTAEDNRLDKTNYLTTVGTIYGIIREEASLIDLSVTIEVEQLPNFNYVYIPNFNRYYYVNDITSIRNNLWEISLSVDVLMSYKEAIRGVNAFVDRNENTFNPNIIDKKRVIVQGVDTEIYTVENDLFNENKNVSCILTGFYTQPIKPVNEV